MPTISGDAVLALATEACRELDLAGLVVGTAAHHLQDLQAAPVDLVDHGLAMLPVERLLHVRGMGLVDVIEIAQLEGGVARSHQRFGRGSRPTRDQRRATDIQFFT